MCAIMWLDVLCIFCVCVCAGERESVFLIDVEHIT